MKKKTKHNFRRCQFFFWNDQLGLNGRRDCCFLILNRQIFNKSRCCFGEWRLKTHYDEYKGKDCYIQVHDLVQLLIQTRSREGTSSLLEATCILIWTSLNFHLVLNVKSLHHKHFNLKVSWYYWMTFVNKIISTGRSIVRCTVL